MAMGEGTRPHTGGRRVPWLAARTPNAAPPAASKIMFDKGFYRI
jgi:hypothetical protein